MHKFRLKPLNISGALLFIALLLLLDQGSKIYIKLNYPLTVYGSQALIDLGFFKLLFVENKGMAMGTRLNDFLPFISDQTAKLVLTLFRLVAIVGLGYWLIDTFKKKGPIL
ncbi:MAG: hypothetical protein EBT72_02690, partial [Flavobacteriia bacterium]|nr:hypothetical protein [Flavobacteriia bacterium]